MCGVWSAVRCPVPAAEREWSCPPAAPPELTRSVSSFLIFIFSRLYFWSSFGVTETWEEGTESTPYAALSRASARHPTPAAVCGS